MSLLGNIMPAKRVTSAILSALVLLPAACGSPRPASDEAPEPAAAGQACEAPEISAAEMEAFEAAAIAQANASQGEGTPALWTLKDEDTTIHILGTVHLLKPEVTWRSTEIEAAIAAADTIVFEADTSGPEAERAMSEFSLAEGLFDDGTQLTSLLTNEEAQRLEAALDGIGLPLSAIQPMKPWFAAINISVFQMIEEGFDPSAGVESEIEKAVEGRDVEFGYLETIDQQLGEFARLDLCTQLGFLMATADSLDQGTEVLDLLVSEWADGDVAGLGALMASPEAFGSEAAYDALLANRNERWVPLIAELLNEPGTKLVAVGAGHMAGPDSVITLLEAEGFAVEGP
jgi:uncharacterized protein